MLHIYRPILSSLSEITVPCFWLASTSTNTNYRSLNSRFFTEDTEKIVNIIHFPS